MQRRELNATVGLWLVGLCILIGAYADGMTPEAGRLPDPTPACQDR